MTTHYVKASSIFDGKKFHTDSALKIADGHIQAIISKKEIPAGSTLTYYDDGMIIPGFVDLQVNGGGGVMFNDAPSVEAIRTICNAHRPFGTTALLVTLITDTAQKTKAAIEAAIEAYEQNIPGFAGLHLEGPHLSVARKGAHDAALIRAMTDDDVTALLDAKLRLPTLLCTVAPESVTVKQVTMLAKAGIIVSLGHSDCDYKTARAFFAAGASMVTHVFNAMSQMGNREPGLVGAALDTADITCGLIADGFHVHPAAMRVALRAKDKPGGIFLVTDAMSTVGSDIMSFTLNGREILARDGRLTLHDGTLAGADIDMASAVRGARDHIGVYTNEAIRMASLYPAMAIKRQTQMGTLKAGSKANYLHVSDRLEIRSVHAA